MKNEADRAAESTSNDGRNIDTAIAELWGEAASQQVNLSKQRSETPAPWGRLPEPAQEDPTYYNVPMLKKPVWEWAIPLYYYVGGLAGASLAFGAVVQFFDRNAPSIVARRCRWIGIAGAGLSGALLIWDLGRPTRFLNMLRVFRPTSPMNMGAWILSGTAPTAFVAEMLWRRNGPLGALGRMSGAASGLFGMGLATYTGVLISNSAIPVWSESRQVLPILFAASAMTSAAATFDMVGLEHEYKPAATFGRIGRTAELLLSFALERKVSAVPRVGLPLHRGKSGFLWKAGSVLTAASLAVTFLPMQKRRRRILSGVLATMGSFCIRFGIHEAGTPSAEDSKASFRLQRKPASDAV